VSASNARLSRSFALLLAAIAALAGLALAVPPAAASSANATITILHGLPNFTADVYVNGTLTLDGFKPESSTEPLSLPAGSYDVAIRDVGSDPNSDPALQATITLQAEKNYTAIAHLSADGQPALNLFENDISKVPSGKCRLVVRNQAQAPAIDVELNGAAVFKGLAPDAEAARNRKAASYMVRAVDATDGAELVAPTPLDLSEGTQTIVYLVGSADNQTLDFMVQDIAGLASDPGSVFSGSGGLAAPDAFPVWAAGLIALCAAVAAGSVVVILKSR
jgi:hypothetical protein